MNEPSSLRILLSVFYSVLAKGRTKPPSADMLNYYITGCSQKQAENEKLFVFKKTKRPPFAEAFSGSPKETFSVSNDVQ
jgi:hypothetical protein